VPAFFHLFSKDRLPESFTITGFARRDFTRETFIRQLQDGYEELVSREYDTSLWERFCSHIEYCQGNFDDGDAFQKLDSLLSLQGNGISNRLYYLATPPAAYPVIINNLGGCNMACDKKGWCRIVIEKPFGRDLKSACELNKSVHEVFAEDQVYRIDHYLGKETAQNLLFFRFGNTLFEPIWNRTYIDHVQISVTEEVDVGHRAGYYDQAGVIRDMIQNHLLQLLTLTAMEPPVSFEADAIRNEKVKILSALRPLSESDVKESIVRAQYTGYCGEKGVAVHSVTPTYAAVKLYIDNWRWHGVPFFIRSGKAMKEKVSSITLQFKELPHLMFPAEPGFEVQPNLLNICIQPNEGMHLRYQVKEPDASLRTRPVNMDFRYGDEFGEASLPEAYERLLLDSLLGDASLFTRSDSIELSWNFIDRIISLMEGLSGPALAAYARDSWGPAEADRLLGSKGRVWQQGC